MDKITKIQIQNDKGVVFHPETSMEMISGLKETIKSMQIRVGEGNHRVSGLTKKPSGNMFCDSITTQHNMEVESSTLNRGEILSVKENDFYDIIEDEIIEHEIITIE